MDARETDKITAFDTLFTNNHIQMLKIMLPYMDNQVQKSMAIIIKLLELNYAVDYYRKNPFPLCGCTEKSPAPDMNRLCQELLPYCNDTERRRITAMQEMLQGMEMYREMRQTMDAVKDFMPELSNIQGGENDSENNFDITNMLLNMLTPEQKQMYELFNQDMER